MRAFCFHVQLPPGARCQPFMSGCPLSPTLFGLFFDGLREHMHSCAPAAGVQFRSGKWVSFLVYADDVVLLSCSASGLQLLLDSMNHFCLGMGLVISPPRLRLLSSMARELQALGGLAPRFFHGLLASQVPWLDISRVWHDVVCTAAAGP